MSLHDVLYISVSYLFSTFTDTIRKPMKIGCADEVCSQLYQESSHIKTAAPDKLPKNRIVRYFFAGHGQEIIKEFQKAHCLIIFLILPLHLE